MNRFRTGAAACICLAALLVPAIPALAQQQNESLGEVARQLRAERQESGQHLKVYTNDDLETPSESAAEAQSESGAQAGKASGNAAAKTSAADADKKQEAEIEKREAETDKQYLDKIADIRKRIAAAKQDVARLQRDQAENTMQFRNSNGIAPSIAEYQQQQQLFTQQIEQQRTLIVTLNSQLEDAKEAARHAGVPHAEDY
jgi:hypothetical protein